jgi:CBS domain-containing protein
VCGAPREPIVDSPAVLIRDVMTESVVTAEPHRTVREVAELMRERNVGSVVLVQDGRPTGFVTDRDLALSVVADGRDFGDHVSDHASSPVIHAEVGMDVEEAAELMVRHGIRRLVVLDGDRLSGIVTLDDLVSRTGDANLAAQLSTRVTRAVMPDFFFHERGGG